MGEDSSGERFPRAGRRAAQLYCSAPEQGRSALQSGLVPYRAFISPVE